MSEAPAKQYDYRHALQELIRELLEYGWGEVVLGLTPLGEYEDAVFASSLQRLSEEFQIEPRIEVYGDLVGFFFGYMPPFTE